MKKILLTTLFFTSVKIYAQWFPLNSGVGTNLKDVFCITEDIVVIVGDEGKILKSTDGGISWQQKNSNSTSYLMKVQFVNNQIGFALGYHGCLLKTIDGGENWQNLISDQIDRFSTGISCINENTIYISENFTLKKSTDGGLSFQTISSGVDRIQFITEQLGYALGDQSLLKTTDGGNTWTSLLTSNYIFDYFFFDDNNGFINTLEGFSKTSDGGQTFNVLDAFDTNINKLYATSPNIVWGLPVACLLNFDPCYSIKAEISSSGDYQRTNGNLLYINSLHFRIPTKGYAVGEWGMIFKNNTGLEGLSVNDLNRKNKSIIFPNPASEKISISLSENTNSSFRIEITDCFGKVVFFKSYLTSSEIEINTRSLSKGIYFVSITSDKQNEIYKLMIK